FSALLADDGGAALRAWDAYYHVSASSPPPNTIAPARVVLADVLPQWQGSEATPADREKLVLALAVSRFYLEAATVASDPRAKDWKIEDRPAVRDVVAYEVTIQRVRDLSDEYYRNIAAGREDPNTYRTALQKEATALWDALSWAGKKPPFDLKPFTEEV